MGERRYRLGRSAAAVVATVWGSTAGAEEYSFFNVYESTTASLNHATINADGDVAFLATALAPAPGAPAYSVYRADSSATGVSLLGSTAAGTNQALFWPAINDSGTVAFSEFRGHNLSAPFSAVYVNSGGMTSALVNERRALRLVQLRADQ